ncbi:MAG: hypothetical protein ACMUJM_02955 [bacterium]
MVYLAEIEEIFSKVRGCGLVLSPINWVIAERWEQMGIPLPVISKGIKKSCRRLRTEEGHVDVLTYCEPRIFSLWKEYKRNLIGDPLARNENAQCEHTYHLVLNKVKRIKRELDEVKMREYQYPEIILSALSQVNYQKILQQVEESVENKFVQDRSVDIEKVETMLSHLDHEMLDTMCFLLPEELKSSFIDEIDKKLEGYREHMEQAVYEESLDLCLKNILREKFMLKRISLYVA